MRNATPSNQSHVKVNQVAAITDALTRVLPATSPADAVLKHFFATILAWARAIDP